jgi:hypothetical protein
MEERSAIAGFAPRDNMAGVRKSFSDKGFRADASQVMPQALVFAARLRVTSS